MTTAATPPKPCYPREMLHHCWDCGEELGVFANTTEDYLVCRECKSERNAFMVHPDGPPSDIDTGGSP